AFAIDSTGHITVNNSAALDYETNPTFALTVKATDTGSLFATATEIGRASGREGAPSPRGVTFSINENTANGSAVGTVTAIDPDAGDSVTYAITAGNTGNAFAIDSAGHITVNNSAALDYEANPAFALTVKATDTGSLFATAT